MTIPEHRKWMVNRLIPGRAAYTNEFISGMDEFIKFACSQQKYLSEKVIRCPCKRCKNMKHLTPDEVNVHVFQKGFTPRYWYWTSHGEEAPSINLNEHVNSGASSSHQGCDFDMPSSSQSNILRKDYEHINRYQGMIYDAAGLDKRHQVEPNVEESPNMGAARFYNMLNSAQEPLYAGCKYSELFVAVKMMSIKSEYYMSQGCFNAMAQLMKETSCPDNKIPFDYYRAKKLVSGLGLTSQKIDCCVNGCMLYYKADKEMTECKFCKEPRYKKRVGKKGNKRIPHKKMHYLPLIPRLQRLYASRRSAEHMRWHYENRREEGMLCHPSDGESWKNFDQTYPDFSVEPMNVRLGLCSDGFTPFSQSASSYSFWPVIVTPYNLPPDICMTAPYMFLTLIIPGPHNPKKKIDVYLQPLIDELQQLWKDGVVTYDMSKKQNFLMRAALMWTINDFPAYGMLSGWSTAGKLACPICMEQSKTFSLKNGRKVTWFDCNRQFLPLNHEYRRNKNAFYKGREEKSKPPPRLTGDQVWEKVRGFPKITESGPHSFYGYGKSHNWTKKSIFWDLPYWKTNLVRHNLDVMHIEKNVFDNIFHTVMDNSERTKDNEKARLDLKEYCHRNDLHLQQNAKGKWIKPKAKFTLNDDQKKDVCEWVDELKMPDGYASNLGRCVDMKHLKLFGMKSHDCHIFMQCLLPVTFSALPKQIWKPLTELSLFFKDLCSTVLQEEHLRLMEENIPVILCKLQRIFPPSLFDSMEHLMMHLPYEARVCGPVQYRWMYPFERFLNKIKKTIKNKFRIEGSIFQAYLAQEISYFASHYFESHILSSNNRVGRNEDLIKKELTQPTLSVFNLSGRSYGKKNGNIRWLDDKEVAAAQLHVLINCDEVKPFLNLYEQTLRDNYSDLTDDVIDKQIEADFPRWFKDYVNSNPQEMSQNSYLRILVMGPLRQARSWPVYFANGYKFHTSSWGEGRSTYNSGVCVSGTGQDGIISEYYGVLKEIIELEWPMTPFMKLVLFYCDWFDPSKHGMKVDSQFGIVEVRKRERYSKFDPFIFPQTATQVYYANHPGNKGDKADWWVVIKTKPREFVDTRYNLEVAYQEEQSHLSAHIEDDPIDCLRDDQVEGEEIDGSNFQPAINENGYDLMEDEDEGATSDEAEHEEGKTSEEEDFLDSDDSQDQLQTEEEDREGD